MLKKPSWFRMIDLFAFVGPSVAVIGLTIYAAIVGVEGDHAMQGLVLMAVIAALFLVFWGINARDRKQWLDSFVWYPKHGFMIKANDGWKLPSEIELNTLVESTIAEWSAFYDARKVVMSDVKWVTFQKNFDETPLNPAHKKVNGMTVAGSHTFGVDIDSSNDPLEKTAFTHELGHVIMGNATGNWNEDSHHQFMKEHGLS
jgi:hypothetical protein